jgi:hypothetical protein
MEVLKQNFLEPGKALFNHALNTYLSYCTAAEHYSGIAGYIRLTGNNSATTSVWDALSLSEVENATTTDEAIAAHRHIRCRESTVGQRSADRVREFLLADIHAANTLETALVTWTKCDNVGISELKHLAIHRICAIALIEIAGAKTHNDARRIHESLEGSAMFERVKTLAIEREAALCDSIPILKERIEYWGYRSLERTVFFARWLSLCTTFDDIDEARRSCGPESVSSNKRWDEIADAELAKATDIPAVEQVYLRSRADSAAKWGAVERLATMLTPSQSTTSATT